MYAEDTLNYVKQRITSGFARKSAKLLFTSGSRIICFIICLTHLEMNKLSFQTYLFPSETLFWFLDDFGTVTIFMRFWFHDFVNLNKNLPPNVLRQWQLVIHTEVCKDDVKSQIFIDHSQSKFLVNIFAECFCWIWLTFSQQKNYGTWKFV